MVARGPIVAIDGPAGAGKSTVAELLAKELGYIRIDTGALYRAVAWSARRAGIGWDASARLGAFTKELNLTFVAGEGPAHLHIDGKDRSAEIREPEISEGASLVSRHAPVRKALLEMQRQLGAQGSVVMEGRDIGTVVFPNADIKIFLTASPEVRARRRVEELKSRGKDASFETTLDQIQRRDRQDTQRPEAPLRAAPDAAVVDTTSMELRDVVARLAEMVRTCLANRISP